MGGACSTTRGIDDTLGAPIDKHFGLPGRWCGNQVDRPPSAFGRPRATMPPVQRAAPVRRGLHLSAIALGGVGPNAILGWWWADPLARS